MRDITTDEFKLKVKTPLQAKSIVRRLGIRYWRLETKKRGKLSTQYFLVTDGVGALHLFVKGYFPKNYRKSVWGGGGFYKFKYPEKEMKSTYRKQVKNQERSINLKALKKL